MHSQSHGRWSEPGFPHRGWTCVDTYDLGPDEDDFMTCEACLSASIRYVHTMEHPQYAISIDVGCVCSGHLEEDYAAPREREKRLKRAEKMRSNYLSTQWRTSRKGNPYLKVRGGAHAVVFQRDDGWSFGIEHDGPMRWSRLKYPTVRAAEIAAVNQLVELATK